MFLTKYFAIDFTFNESSGMNSSWKVQTCASKSVIKDQINLPTALTFAMFLSI